MRRWAGLLALSAAVGCSSAPPPPSVPGATARVPYDSPPVAYDAITVILEMRAAREILAVLSGPKFDPVDAKALEALPAVQYTLVDAHRQPEVFESDLEAAFATESRASVFDFRRIRDERNRWADVLATIGTREAELTRLVAERAKALMPAQPTVAVKVHVYLTFGIAGRADHLVVPAATGGGRAIVIDLSRALEEDQGSSREASVAHLTRLMTMQAYQLAWEAYRAESATWRKHDASLGQLELLLRAAAEAGPVYLYTYDENFFPLSIWLKDQMKASIDELNRVADRMVSATEDLDERLSLVASIRHPEFTAEVAGPAGAFLADAIFQTLGIDAYRAALAGGPRAYFEAYDRAVDMRGRQLIPVAQVIRDRLAGVPPSKPPPKPHR
jgi:hypothetical protein